MDRTVYVRGLAQLVMVLLIVAVSIICIFVMISWISHVLRSSSERYFTIYPYLLLSHAESSEKESSIILKLYVSNEGTESFRILRIVVDCGQTVLEYIPKNGYIEIKPGSKEEIVIEEWNIVTDEEKVNPGSRCRVRIYTEETVMLYDVIVCKG